MSHLPHSQSRATHDITLSNLLPVVFKSILLKRRIHTALDLGTQGRLSRILQGLTLKRHIDATLGQGNIKEAVRLPPGEDLNEWLAVNTVDFYNAISVLHGTLEEFCTPSACPAMAAGAKVTTCLPVGCEHGGAFGEVGVDHESQIEDLKLPVCGR